METTTFDLSVMPTLTFVKSSNMLGISYDEETKDLYVLFKQKTLYKYADVPKDVYDEFIKAESVGSFFFKRIKSKYECKKVGTIKSSYNKVESNETLLITSIDLDRGHLLINKQKISIPSNE